MSPEAIVIGSGPGGATVAEVLTRAGWSVVILEKGRNHLLDPDDLTRPSGDYSNDEIKFVSRYFLGPDPLVEPRAFRRSAEEGEHTHVGEVNSIPTTVGGGGTHADGKVPRFREEDFGLLSTYGPQEGAAVDDWPLDYEELEPYYAEVERAIGVSGRAGANPFAAWRSGPYPMPPGAPMYGAVLSSAAAEKVGLHPYEAPTAANSIAYDGRPACNNCGFCAFFGCPIHAKGDPVALLTKAMATGRAELMAETYVSRIITNGRRATGVEFIGPDGVTRTREAELVVVAGGAIETPRLLLLSGLDHPALGKYLMVHFQTIVVGHFPTLRLHPHKGRSVTHVHDDAMVQDDRTRTAAAGAGLPWFRGGLVEHSGGGLPIMEARHSPWGRQHAQVMRESNLRERMWAFIMQGEDLPYATNTIDLSPSIRDAAGLPRRPRDVPAGPPRAGGVEVPRKDPAVRAGGDGRRVGDPHVLPGRLVPRGGRHADPREPPCDGHGPHGGQPGHLDRGPLGQGACARQRGRRRFIGVRHLERLRAHADPRGPGLTGGAPPGGDDARRPRRVVNPQPRPEGENPAARYSQRLSLLQIETAARVPGQGVVINGCRG